ncbi:MAG: hypothetical protein ACFBWO_07960 [Paracoccaceae bacterium]
MAQGRDQDADLAADASSEPTARPPGRGSAGQAPRVGEEALPVALATVTVAGQCRERSPADEALFGSRGARFAERFADAAQGQRLLSRALADGTAEGAGTLIGAAGPFVARVSLWRQRSGERIRLVAAFAADPPAGGRHSAGEAERLALVRFAALLRLPAEAALALAHRLRSLGGDGADGAAEAVAALWRVVALVGDMGTWRPGRLTGAGHGADECDLSRLARRVMRLAEPLAAREGATLALPAPSAASAVLVVADQAALWSGLETLVRTAIAHAGPGGSVRAALGAEAGGLVLAIESARSPEAEGGRATETETLEALALIVAAGARLDVAPIEANRRVATIRFPPERCVPLP